jgi:hypothetical protein
MNRHQPYRERIDACRPGSDDLSLPALAELAAAIETDHELADELARSQRFDGAVARAMHDVPLPAGLADRVLARLAQVNAVAAPLESSASHPVPLEQGVIAATAPALPSADQSPTPAVADSARGDLGAGSRRRWISAALAAAAALLIAVGFWQLNGSRPRQISEHELASAGMQWFNEAAPRTGWKASKTPLPGFPLDRAITATPTPLPQRSFRTALGEPAVAYQLAARPKGAVLYVVQTKLVYPVTTIPYKRLGTSGNVSIAAWQRGNLLYVLAVDGGPQQLDAFVKRPRLTALPPPFALSPV